MLPGVRIGAVGAVSEILDGVVEIRFGPVSGSGNGQIWIFGQQGSQGIDELWAVDFRLA
jgi:hypothetical protein